MAATLATVLAYAPVRDIVFDGTSRWSRMRLALRETSRDLAAVITAPPRDQSLAAFIDEAVRANDIDTIVARVCPTNRATYVEIVRATGSRDRAARIIRKIARTVHDDPRDDGPWGDDNTPSRRDEMLCAVICATRAHPSDLGIAMTARDNAQWRRLIHVAVRNDSVDACLAVLGACAEPSSMYVNMMMADALGEMRDDFARCASHDLARFVLDHCALRADEALALGVRAGNSALIAVARDIGMFTARGLIRAAARANSPKILGIARALFNKRAPCRLPREPSIREGARGPDPLRNAFDAYVATIVISTEDEAYHTLDLYDRCAVDRVGEIHAIIRNINAFAQSRGIAL